MTKQLNNKIEDILGSVDLSVYSSVAFEKDDSRGT
ncbi:hypothetical protein HNQ55_002981 [Thalassotalea piscium]|uniref:Uncharacterized protein n=1 Tax=Thalassotalea piscium TaxID=1230533 RepID=A0A7X0NJC0_9GAMM|nr:hypothetical protein [Thalassotalea piscium]